MSFRRLVSKKVQDLVKTSAQRREQLLKNRLVAALLGLLYTGMTLVPLFFFDRRNSFDKRLGTNQDGETCELETLPGYPFKVWLIAFTFFWEIVLLGVAACTYGLQKEFEHDNQAVDWASTTELRSALGSMFGWAPRGRKENIVLIIWAIHILSVLPVIMLGPLGVGSYFISVLIEALVFNPSEDEEAKYQLGDTGILARILLLVSFAIHWQHGDKVVLVTYVAVNISWDIICRMFRSPEYSKVLYSLGFVLLALLDLLFSIESKCPIGAMLYVLLITASPEGLFCAVNLLVLSVFVAVTKGNQLQGTMTRRNRADDVEMGSPRVTPVHTISGGGDSATGKVRALQNPALSCEKADAGSETTTTHSSGDSEENSTKEALDYLDEEDARQLSHQLSRVLSRSTLT